MLQGKTRAELMSMTDDEKAEALLAECEFYLDWVETMRSAPMHTKGQLELLDLVEAVMIEVKTTVLMYQAVEEVSLWSLLKQMRHFGGLVQNSQFN